MAFVLSLVPGLRKITQPVVRVDGETCLGWPGMYLNRRREPQVRTRRAASTFRARVICEATVKSWSKSSEDEAIRTRRQ